MRDLVQIMRGLLMRAVVKMVGSQKMPIVRALGTVEIEAEHLQPYGLASKPLPGAEAVAGMIGGTSHPVILVIGDRRHRPEGLRDGDVALHDSRGQVLYLEGSGARLVASLLQVHCGAVILGNLAVSGTASADSMTAATITGGVVSGGSLSAGAGGFSVGGTSIPLPGASGSFVSHDGKTVTVSQGIVTGIV